MSCSRVLSYLLYDAEFTWDLFLPECLLTCFLGDQLLDLTVTQAFLRTFCAETGSVSGRPLNHFLRIVLAVLSGIIAPGGQSVNQHLHIGEQATLLPSFAAHGWPPPPPHSSAYQGPFQIDFHLFQSFHSKFRLWLLIFPRVARGTVCPPYFLPFFYIYCSITLHQASG